MDQWYNYFLLAPNKIDGDSCHTYSEEFYESLIKHEMMNVFITFLSILIDDLVANFDEKIGSVFFVGVALLIHKLTNT